MNMNLKGIMQTLGAKPGQVVSNPYVRAFAPQVETIVKEEEDHEVSMAQNSLDTIIKMATELKAKMGENEKDIPAWIQDHITNSENFISQASSNYHEYSTNEAGINGAPRFPSLDGVANESVNEAPLGKKRFMFDFYTDSFQRNTERETNYISDSLESAIKAAEHICKVTGYGYVEIHYKDLFLGSMKEKNKFEFVPGKGYSKFKSVNEASRRATDFYGDSKHGKAIDLLLKGKWDSKKVENFLEKLGGGNDVKYARIIDFISGDAGLNIRKYKNIGEQLPDLMKQLEVLYKDFLSESVNKSLRLTKLK
jgi:hypothetical protein